MALDMTPEEKEIGKANFDHVSEQLSRRGFMKTVAAGAAVVPVSAAAYFGYQYETMQKRPVKAAIIGTGDEGGVLVGEHNPEYLEFIACADIRPTQRKRIFEGDSKPTSPRKGFNRIYGKDAASRIKVYVDYKEMLASEPEIEAVVIALPLHLHAPVAIDCLNAKKHVLCEKLMAWNINQCKEMIKAAERNDRILTIGHQRHYSLLYAQAVEVIKSGVLGDIKHIRALWHRNNTWPRVDKKGRIIPGELRDSWRKSIPEEDAKALANELEKWDYKSMEELVRWRLYQRTGGGLMAELGSHQLDACSIFLGKVHPLAVTGVGGKYFYTDDREIEDHVFCTFEFPGPDYYVKDKNGNNTAKVKNKDDIVVVTYSSINTNSFENYGECVMGTRGTLIVESEQTAMLWTERDPNKKDSGPARSTAATVVTLNKNQPILDSSSTTGPAEVAASGQTAPGRTTGPVSRGYREEMEHFAYCIRRHQEAQSDEERRRWRREPRCNGYVAMADAIIALTANQAMRKQQRIVFQDSWFDPTSSEVPDGDMIPTNAKGKRLDLASS
ncbi:MAG: NADH-dependent dehydrogenase [Gemmatales bacterium]|nr:MAG: NADH-dependent dehydrogenase [Gemmatales bacterium]